MANINQRLALYWPMDNLDNGSINDISGNLFQGTVEGVATLTDDSVFNSVIQLGPAPGALYTQPDSIKNAFANTATQFTICGWIKPNATTEALDRCQIGNVFFSYGTPSQEVVELGLNFNNVVQVFIRDQSGVISPTNTSAVPIGEWSFIALSYQVNSVYLLVNTQMHTFDVEVQGLNSPAPGVLRIGKSVDGVCGFQGLVCNFRVFNDAWDIIGLMEVMKADLSSPLQLFLPLNSAGYTNTPDRSQFEYPVVAHGNPKPTLVSDPVMGNITQFDGSSAYFAIDDFHYKNQGEIQQITISFWLKATANPTTQTIISFDATDFYEVILDDTGRLFWITVDRYGNVDRLHSTIVVTDNYWRYITVQYCAGTGYKSILFGGALIESRMQVHLGQPLGLHSSIRYGTIGVNSMASEYNTEIGDQFFNGSLAQLRLYHALLMPGQILADMDNSYPATPSFADHNPVAISFYQSGEPDVFYRSGPRVVTLNISNVSSQGLLLEAISAPVTPDNAQFSLYFKQGILNTADLTLGEPDLWNLATSGFQPDGSIYFYLNAKVSIIISEQQTLPVTLENFNLNTAAGVQSTRIGMNYQNCYFNDTSALVTGYAEVVVGLENG